MPQIGINGIDVPAYIIATVIGLAMCLWGVQLARFISSLAFGAIMGYTAYIFTYRVFHSVALSILFALIAILIGFIIGFTLFRVVLSIIFGYTLATILVREAILILLMTVILAVIIYVLSSYLLAILFVATGASLIYKSITILGLHHTVALIIVAIVGIVGVYNQLRRRL